MRKTTRCYAAALLGALLLWGSVSPGGEDAAPRADKVSMTGEGAYSMKISPPVMSRIRLTKARPRPLPWVA